VLPELDPTHLDHEARKNVPFLSRRDHVSIAVRNAQGGGLKTMMDRLMDALVEAVRLLAAEPEDQIDALPDFVHAPDEIALTYSDAYLAARPFWGRGIYGRREEVLLDGLDRFLARLSEDKSLWTLEALRTCPQWHTLRLLAREVLDALGRDRRKPVLFWVRYVQGNTGSGQ
jgi:hypothetical protein